MDQQQQQRVNEAADQFTSALVESFRAVSARGEAAQEQGAQLTRTSSTGLSKTFTPRPKIPKR